MWNGLWMKGLVFGIVCVCIGVSIIPCTLGINEKSDNTLCKEEISKKMIQQVCFADPPKEDWNTTFGGPETDYGYDVQPAHDDGYIIVGDTYSYGSGSCDIWVIKTDSKGNEQWNKTYGGLYLDYGKAIRKSNTGGYIILGVTEHIGGDYDIWLIKIDTNGNVIWNKTYGYGGSSDEQGNCLSLISDGGFIIAGEREYEDNGIQTDLLVIRTDSNGNQLWNKMYGGISTDRGQYIQETSDHGFIITGVTSSFGSNPGNGDIWLLKIDSNGNEIWNKTYGGLGLNIGFCIQETQTGGYIIAGMKTNVDINMYDWYIIKTNSIGVEQWNYSYGQYNENDDICYSVLVTSDDSYVIAGFTTIDYSMKIALIKLDSDGDLIWVGMYGKLGCYYVSYSIHQTNDGGYILTGGNLTQYDTDVFLMKMKSESNEPPEAPTIDGPASIKPKIAYQWNFTSVDPNNDNVFYQIDWGDGDVSEWYGSYPSGETMSQSHVYEYRGQYTIKARAKDIYGNDSAWATLSIKVPYSSFILFQPFWERLFERFPHAFPILRHMMGY